MLTIANKFDIIYSSIGEADLLCQNAPLVCDEKATAFPIDRRTRGFLLEKNMNALKLKYYRTYIAKIKKTRPWYLFYIMIKGRCHNRTNRYTQRGIKCLITGEDIKYLWFRDKAWQLKQPSIDRINGKGHYEKSNCRFIEFKENLKRKKDVINYPKTRPWKRVSVNQFDKNGQFIKNWSYLGEVDKEFGLKAGRMSACLIKKQKYIGGYIWKYA